MNSKTPWTPGPWQRSLACEMKGKSPPYNVWTIIGNTAEDERKHSVVATTITDDNDARLIAAAPELVEALRSCFDLADACFDDLKRVGYIEHTTEQAYRQARESARTLLAKLEGGQA